MRRIFEMLADTLCSYIVKLQAKCHEFVSVVADVNNFCFKAEERWEKAYVAK